MAGTLTRALLVTAAALGLLATGCSSGSAKVNAGAAGSVSASGSTASPSATDPPASAATSSPPAGSPTPNATTTVIEGDATSFCGAFKELHDKDAAARNNGQAVTALYESSADMKRFAPDSLRSQVAVLANGLRDVGTNLAVGLYANTQDLNNALHQALGTPQAQAVSRYLKAHCH
jgi:hypothetical protein